MRKTALKMDTHVLMVPVVSFCSTWLSFWRNRAARMILSMRTKRSAPSAPLSDPGDKAVTILSKGTEPKKSMRNHVCR